MEVDQPRAADNVHRIRTRIELGEHSITNVSLGCLLSNFFINASNNITILIWSGVKVTITKRTSLRT